MSRTEIRAMALVLSAAGFAVSAEPAHDTLHFTMERYPGYFGEYCLELEQGETVGVSIESPYPVRVNLHYHDDAEEARYLLDEVKADDEQSSVSITEDGEYCFQITNFEPRPERFELTLSYEVTAP